MIMNTQYPISICMGYVKRSCSQHTAGKLIIFHIYPTEPRTDLISILEWNLKIIMQSEILITFQSLQKVKLLFIKVDNINEINN